MWKTKRAKGQKKSKWFFQVDVSSKKRTNEFYFTTMKPQFDLFSFVFWMKLKTPKRHFEINWPLIEILRFIMIIIYLFQFLEISPSTIPMMTWKRVWRKLDGSLSMVTYSELQITTVCSPRLLDQAFRFFAWWPLQFFSLC